MPADWYVPDDPAASPPVVVSLHYCSGNRGNAQPWFQSYADQYGFVIITPQAGGECFDAAPARSGERAEIVKMVDYVVAQQSGDTSRVFAAGASSGACMTQALLAAYPEVFAAGSSLAGVPAGAWTGGNAYGWSSPNQSAQQWGDKVRQVNPDFSGPWPRIQLWQGQGDTTLTYSQNYPAEVAQWTNVWGFTDADGMNEMIKPMGAQDTWDRTSYEDDSGTVAVEANSGPSNVPHDLTGRGLWGDVVRFFALDMPGDTGDTGGNGGTAGTAAGGATSTGSTGSTGAAGGTGMGGASTGAAGSTSMASVSGTDGAGITTSTTGGMSSGDTTTTGSGGTSGTSVNTSAGLATTSPSGSVTSGTTTGGNVVGGTDGMSGSNAGANDSDEGGCSCRIGTNRGAPHSALVLLGLGAVGLLLGRRRRRDAHS